MLYLHSTYHVEPGKMAEYLDIVERLQIPYGEKRGLHLVGYWQTANVPGPTTDLTAVYSIASWSAWAKLVEEPPEPKLGAMVQEYLAKAEFLRPRYESKFLVPVPFSPLK